MPRKRSNPAIAVKIGDVFGCWEATSVPFLKKYCGAVQWVVTAKCECGDTTEAIKLVTHLKKGTGLIGCKHCSLGKKTGSFYKKNKHIKKPTAPYSFPENITEKEYKKTKKGNIKKVLAEESTTFPSRRLSAAEEFLRRPLPPAK